VQSVQSAQFRARLEQLTDVQYLHKMPLKVKRRSSLGEVDMILQSISDERHDLERDRGHYHISEIVPLVLARIGAAETQPAMQSRPKTNLLPSHIMPTPSVLASV